MKKHITTNVIIKQALLAALYFSLTYIVPAFSYGPIQFRISEVLTLLAFYNPQNVLGLTLGCALSNVMSPFGIIDVVVGSFHTFISTYMMTKIKNFYVASLMPGVFSFIIGLEIYFLTAEPINFFATTLQIMASEFIIVSVIGVILFKTIQKSERAEALLRNF